MNIMQTRWIKPLLILLLALVVAAIMIATGKSPERVAVIDQGVLVSVDTVESKPQRLSVAANGTVLPAVQVSVRPEVSGRIVWVSPQLAPGGLLKAGEKLLQIDTADYELAVAMARSALADAEARLALEKGRQEIAEREWGLFAGDADAETADSALALRKPQQQSAEAAVASAQARLAQEQLRLQRSSVYAEFNAFVRSESVDLGQTVNPQTTLAVLAGTDGAWIQAAVPVASLAAISFPDQDGGQGANVIVRYEDSMGAATRTGRVVRSLGDLDPAGRLARVLIEIDDPLALNQRSGKASPLLIDSYVGLTIEGQEVSGLVELPRSWLHNGDTVYLYADGKLQIRNVQIAWREPEIVLVSAGLEVGEQVISSAIATPVVGMKLRLPGITPGDAGADGDDTP